jgi:cytochrome c oxidase subunit 2
MLAAVSDIAREVDEAFYWIGGICLVLLVGITVTMVLFLVKYRHKRSPRATQIEGNLPLELTWIIIPTIIVLFMFFKGYEGFKLMRTVPEGAMVIKVTGQRWFWTFEYPEQAVSSDRLVVPVDMPVKLELTAPPDDVVHSLYLPAFRIKEDCVPGRQNYLWFQSEKEGTFNIFCAEYCGRDHSKMITELEVVSPAGYEEWLAMKVADKNRPVDMQKAMDPNSAEIVERDGPKLYETYCASCHGKNGLGGLVEGARNFTTLADWKNGPTITQIYRTLENGLEGTQMRSFSNLPPWDRFALAHHVAAYYKGTGRPEDTPEEIEKLREEYSLDETVEPRETIPIEDAMKAIVDEAAGAGEAGKDRDE